MKLKLLIIVIAATAFALSRADAAAKIVGEFDDWDAATDGKGKNRVCYASTKPKKSAGKYKKRGEVSVLIAHWPGRKQFGIVSINMGYGFKAKAEAIVKIGDASFDLFTQGETAWAYKGDDPKLVQAMRAGASMVVAGVSKRGTKTLDTYSLKGVSAAIKAIDKACRKR